MYGYRKLLPMLFLLMLAQAVSVKAQFTITGEIRPRAEFRNGFKTLTNTNTDPAFFVEQRSRLYFGYAQDKFKLKLTLQDVRIWGSVGQIYKEDPALSNVYEAWGAYALSNKFSLKVGRQALDYDNARFLGNLDWAQQGRSHDALLLMFKDSSGVQVHVGAGFNQNVAFEPAKLSGTLYEGVGNYKTMQFLWFHKDFKGVGGLSALFFNDGRQTITTLDTTVSYRQTYGIVGHIKLGRVKLNGEFYYQGGKNGAGTEVDALLASVSATFKTKLTPLTVGVDYLTGTEATDSKDRSFAPLYGTNHKFYGLMDYFYVGNGHQNLGLIDIFFKTKFRLSKKAALLAHYHHFNTAANIPAEQGSTSLGDEVDLVLAVKMTKGASFKLGYSQMFATDGMEAIKGGDKTQITNWAWAMLTIKPVLFSTKKKRL